ncbi:MAG TPA: hypothetical protein H9667_07865 [Firmicutes bacterium]|nr:hypothetical protein [Bacillota bacterium]
MRGDVSSETRTSMSKRLNQMFSSTEADLRKENQELKRLLTEEKIRKIQLYKELMDSLAREEILVDECERFERRYEALKESSLGKVTLKYWAFRKKLRR